HRVGFFFPAEDGIRDLIVTGVQTCALPILIDEIPMAGTAHRDLVDHLAAARLEGALERIEAVLPGREVGVADHGRFRLDDLGRRSEERRVGKECRFAWGKLYSGLVEWTVME